MSHEKERSERVKKEKGRGKKARVDDTGDSHQDGNAASIASRSSITTWLESASRGRGSCPRYKN